jgi:hypothetical protein
VSNITTLSIKPEVMKAVRVINRLLPKCEQKKVMSFVWYNGRERGVALVVGDHPRLQQRVLVINECRGSDQLVLDTYEREWTTDQPCWEDPGYEKAYQNRHYYAYQDYDAIARKVNSYIVETNRKQESVEAKMTDKAKIKKAAK